MVERGVNTVEKISMVRVNSGYPLIEDIRTLFFERNEGQNIVEAGLVLYQNPTLVIVQSVDAL